MEPLPPAICHAQITLTLGTYDHVLPETQAEAVEAMSDMLGSVCFNRTF